MSIAVTYYLSQLQLFVASAIGEQKKEVRMSTIILFLCLLLTSGVESTATAWGGIAEFLLTGDSMFYSYGIYRAEPKVGSPARAYQLEIDTGSTITWILCNGNRTDLSYYNAYNLNNTSSVSILTCGDKRCGSIFPTSRKCAGDEPCPYSVTYGDASGSSGFYVSDIVHLEMKGPNSMIFESSANLVFGCATKVHGSFQSVGMLGLSHERASIISQLYLQGKIPKVFSHCLSGTFEGGGFLVLGEAQGTSNISYTPLFLSSSHYYNVEVESIAVDGKKLDINQQAFANSRKHGTFVDSGTTFINLVPKAYHRVIDAISSVANLSPYKGAHPHLHCYWGNLTSLMEKFPKLTFSMKGDVSIILHPSDYLAENGVGFTCLGLKQSSGGLNILGEIVWKDKLVIYDLQNKRIGWSSYNCSVSPNVKLIYPTESSIAAYNRGVGGLILFLGFVVAVL